MSSRNISLKHLKIKAPDPLGLPLFLDPKDLKEPDEYLRREKRILRSQQRLEAYVRNPEKFQAWQHRIERFYKRAIWGAPPPSEFAAGFRETARSKRNLSLFSRQALDQPVQLPSQTLWHYYYYNGKTRAERRATTLKRIECMRLRHKASLEERKRAHRLRIKRFARIGLQRKQRSLALSSDTCAVDIFPVDALEEASAKAEAARRIQYFYRERLSALNSDQGCLATASVCSADAAVQTDELFPDLIRVDHDVNAAANAYILPEDCRDEGALVDANVEEETPSTINQRVQDPEDNQWNEVQQVGGVEPEEGMLNSQNIWWSIDNVHDEVVLVMSSLITMVESSLVEVEGSIETPCARAEERIQANGRFSVLVANWDLPQSLENEANGFRYDLVQTPETIEAESLLDAALDEIDRELSQTPPW